MMSAVKKNRSEFDLSDLVRLQGDEIRRKNRTIIDMEAMLSTQAEKLVAVNSELTVCRRRLGMRPVVV